MKTLTITRLDTMSRAHDETMIPRPIETILADHISLALSCTQLQILEELGEIDTIHSAERPTTGQITNEIWLLEFMYKGESRKYRIQVADGRRMERGAVEAMVLTNARVDNGRYYLQHQTGSEDILRDRERTVELQAGTLDELVDLIMVLQP